MSPKIKRRGAASSLPPATPRAALQLLLVRVSVPDPRRHPRSQIHRRPYAVGAEDIGTWFTFLDIMSTVAVITNMSLFVFTGSQLNGWSWKERVVFFTVMEHVLLTLKYFIALIIPDVPTEVTEQQAREAFIVSKVKDNIADDAEDEEYDTVEMIDLSVKLTDLVPALDRDTVGVALS